MAVRQPKAGSIVLTTTATGFSAAVDVTGFDIITLFLARTAGGAGNVGLKVQLSNDISGSDWFDDGAAVDYAASANLIRKVVACAKRLRIEVSTLQGSSVMTCEYLMAAISAGSDLAGG